MKIRSRMLTKIAGWMLGRLFRLWARTLRYEPLTEVSGTDPSFQTNEPYLYALWHDAILVPIAKKALNPSHQVAALVSRHQDGAYLAEFMLQTGIRSIRGSSRHGGSEAVRQLMREGEHCNVFITPDGPRGPKWQIKTGIVFLASQTGMPILPVASHCYNGWLIRGNWTDLAVPKPFSRVAYMIGAPLEIPPDLPRAELEAQRLRVQSEMERLAEKLQAHVRGEAAAEPLQRAA